ncbi:MAG TPA: wax ester/triacylglycerol synthase domain-containing protein, partial [Baekduia sp.]|nr:wax ester/triacylglycerol synthase domain-containing protein [Baekduia sp.]
MDRPTALDLAFFDLETPQAPIHVGWTLRFGGDAPSLAALRRHLDARLGAVPRFRRRLVAAGPLGLAGPSWVDDPGFDVARHAFGVSLPAPGGVEQLRQVAGTLLSQPLPADRPLWRIYLLDGLDRGGAFALVGQAHHALVDGIAAVEVALLLFGPPSAGGLAAGGGWAPAAGPRPGEALR